MPILTGECANHKPIVSVGLAPVLPKAGEVQAVPQSPAFPVTPLRALLDTGADGTSISVSVARSHSLLNYGKRNVIGIGGSGIHNTWAAFLGFFFEQDADFEGDNHRAQSLFVIPDALMAVEIPDNRWFDVIIGRDVLTRFEFRILKGGKWLLELS